MVDPTLRGRIDYREVVRNVDFESIFEGTRFEGDDGVLAYVGGELGERLGRILGAVVGYLLGVVVFRSTIGGDGGDGDTDADGGATDDASGDADENEGETQEADA